MTIRAYIRDDFAGRSFDVVVVNHVEDVGGQRDFVLKQDSQGFGTTWDVLDPEQVGFDRMTGPTYRIPRDVAHELFAALGRALEMAPTDAVALRKDYLAERARVDKMLDALIASRPFDHRAQA